MLEPVVGRPRRRAEGPLAGRAQVATAPPTLEPDEGMAADVAVAADALEGAGGIRAGREAIAAVRLRPGR